MVREIPPALPRSGRDLPQLQTAAMQAAAALEDFSRWLKLHLPSMTQQSAIGRTNYIYFLRNVALLPYTPEQMLAVARQEWQRAVAFESFERRRDRSLPPLKIFSTVDQEVLAYKDGEQTIRDFLTRGGILSVPETIRHFIARPVPRYLDALAAYGELDDFTGPSRLTENSVRWIHQPSPELGFWEKANAQDPRPNITHEGIPGHYFQLAWSWTHPDPIRRYYYDSGPNEGLAFYTEEMLLQAGLYENSPRSRELVYTMARLRALRVEVDVKLALGEFSIRQAAEYLARMVPMSSQSAEEEAAFFATTPGQAITYQIGKQQIVRFLADARLKLGDKFDLRAFHDFLWQNGNVPITLQRWEYLGLDDDLTILDSSDRTVR
jgi:hypothetical protein